jgi:hypothetical protein
MRLIARLLALLGGTWGLVCALALSAIRFANSAEPERDVISTAAFALVYAAPFILALLALLWKNAILRAAVWFAAAVLAYLASWTAFSGIGLIFLPAAPLLLFAAALSAALAIQTWGVRPALPILPISFGLIAVGIAAFIVLITLTSDPRCWVLMRYTDGHQTWEISPPDVASITVFTGPNGQQAIGSGRIPPPSATGSSIVTSRCTSDFISPIEAVVSIALWLVAGVGLFVLQRNWSAAVAVKG